MSKRSVRRNRHRKTVSSPPSPDTSTRLIPTVSEPILEVHSPPANPPNDTPQKSLIQCPTTWLVCSVAALFLTVFLAVSLDQNLLQSIATWLGLLVGFQAVFFGSCKVFRKSEPKEKHP